jgi:hypothetical protein
VAVAILHIGRFSGFPETDELMRQQLKTTSLAYPSASKVKRATFFHRYAGPTPRHVFSVLFTFIIDEIGKMECSSEVFIEAVMHILASPVPVLATVATKGSGFISEVKARHDVDLLMVSRDNRDKIPEEIVRRLVPA